MNPRDLENVRFIMSLNEQQFEAWASTLSEDDIEYAINIVKAARTEVLFKSVETDTPIEDFSEANAVLKKFML